MELILISMNDLDRKEYERESYNRHAEGILQKHSDTKWNYGSFSNRIYLSSPYRYIEDKFLIDLTDKKVLDYCCGTGLYSIFPALNGAFVHGMDISEESIEVAKMRAKFWNVSDRTDFKPMDAEKLEYEDNSFDIVMSYGSLSYMVIEKAYSEIARVVKNDGFVIVVDTLGHNPILNLYRKRHIKSGRRQKYHYNNILTIKKIELAKNYFKQVDVKFFDLLVLFGQLLPVAQIQKLVLPTLRGLDSILLQIPPVNRLAFKFVAAMRKPICKH